MISPEQVKQNRRKNSTHEATDGVAVIERKIEKTTKKKNQGRSLRDYHNSGVIKNYANVKWAERAKPLLVSLEYLQH